MNEYDFSEWSQYRKEQRMSELIDAAEVPQSDERRLQITREMTHLMFEMDYFAELGEPDGV